MPIRLALIGLSSSATTSWAAQGHLPYLLSPRGRSHYEIVALLNSSPSAASAAKAHFGLPSSVRTYGDPSTLATDPDVDLVVCNTRVDVHYSSVEPSVRAGKAVYVEWPLVESLERAEELLRGGGEEGRRGSVVGLQGRVAPVVMRLKEVVESGRVGRVLSSEFRAFGNLMHRDRLPEGLRYFAERRVGGSPVNISFGHTVDYVHHVLGEWEEGWKARMQVQRPVLDIVDAQGKKTATVESDVPDYLAVQGGLKESKWVIEGATLAGTYRTGAPFKGDPAFVWTINGEKGEIKLTSQSGPYIFSGDSYTEKPRLHLHDFATDKVKEVEWDWASWQKELPLRARITGEVYERYAKWWEGGKAKSNATFPALDDAVNRLKEFDILFDQYDQQR